MDRLLSMRVFQRVIDEGGFAAAARALDLSPAVVTRLVADLEAHLGARLLHRSTRRVSLSDAGEAYLNRVRAILQDIDEADLMASAHTQELSGVLRLLAPPALATHILAPLVAGFRLRYPHIRIDVEVSNLAQPPIEDYDITLFAADMHFDGDVIARKILTAQAVLIAAPSYLARKGTPTLPEQLSAHDCLRLRTVNVLPPAWRLMRPHDPHTVAEPHVVPVLQANHTDTLLRAALGGAGITAAPMDLVAGYLASGDLVRVLSPWITGEFTLYAALPSRQFLPQRTRVFLDYLTEQTQQLVASALISSGPACAPRPA